MKNKSINQFWGGRFNEGPAEVMEQINNSIGCDQRLYEYDISASIVHAKMLGKKEIITESDSEAIITGLQQILSDIEGGKIEFKQEFEDIHMNIEYFLKCKVGAVSGKLHTARSRNDQVLTDFKLWIRNAIQTCDTLIRNFQVALVDTAEANIDVIMPGFTHLQVAQPVNFAHHMLAYVEMLKRDRERFADCQKRMNECPLGCAALAGTSFPIDRNFVSEELSFTRPTRNSLDTVSDRDFVIEFISCISICTMHLSRLAEEIVLWSSNNFNFITLSDAFTSGSSIMPQKRNPDAAELVRAKTGRVFGMLNAILIVMKALPLAYSKDMQEDKELGFDAFDTLVLCINAMHGIIADIVVNKENMLHASELGYSTATDLADWLVQNIDIPFRDCHAITGKIVNIASARNVKLEQLSLQELQAIEPRITQEIFSVLSVLKSINSRTSYGGTATNNVMQMISILRLEL